ncbi:hypothetical protein [Saccharopolyspora gloriosae]|uniref:hypothetical protein n=1 Tax=Saccharopolyspora gloriosae TaxID=455344 RepID=UPI001FB7DB08|nr:hypothetical protein [Saccharopolyspora gloriosae]
MSFEWERRMKLRLLLAGLVLVILSPVVALIGIPWTFFLPIADDPLSWLTAGMIGVSAFFSWIVGLCCLFGQANFRGGCINVAGARSVLRQSVVWLIGTVCTSGLSVACLALIVGTSAGRSYGPISLDLELCSYLGLAVLPVGMAGVAWGVLLKSMRPDPQ